MLETVIGRNFSPPHFVVYLVIACVTVYTKGFECIALLTTYNKLMRETLLSPLFSEWISSLRLRKLMKKLV